MSFGSLKSSLKRILPLVVGIALLAYTVRNMPIDSFMAQWHQASTTWVLSAVLIIMVQMVLRAIRWRMLLRSLGYRLSLFSALTSTMAGNVMALIIPGSGELTRCTLVYRANGIPIPQSLGTALAERFVDLAATLLLILLTLLLQTSRLLPYLQQYATLPPAIRQATITELFTFGIGLAFSFLTGFWLIRIGWKRLPERYRFRDKLAGLRQGIASAWRVQNIPLYLLLNVGLHSLSLVCLYWLFRALPITCTLPVSAALTVVAVSSLGSLTIPTQANLGSYHFLASRALLAYGISLENGVIWATFSHAVIMATSLLMSALGAVLIWPLLQHAIRTPAETQTSTLPKP